MNGWYLYFLSGFVLGWVLKWWVDWKFKNLDKEEGK